MKILLICHFFSSYMKDLIEQHYRYNGIIFDVATTDPSYKYKVSSKAVGNIFLFRDYQSFHELMSAVDYYDVIEIHFVDMFYSMNAELIRSKCEILNCCVWGSDYYRVSEEDKRNQKKLYDLADHIIFGNPSTLSDFNEDFQYKEDKLKVCQFGLSVLEEIDAVTEADIEMFLEKYGISKDKLIVTIGHNASESQQHKLIINALNSASDSLLNRTQFIFPLTYGSTSEYKDSILECLKDSKLDYIVFLEYMTKKEIAISRKISRLFIQFQKTDQLSGSMQEFLYAENCVLTGAWLPYDIFDKVGIYMERLSSIELELETVIKYIFDNLNDNQKIFKKNSMLIYNMASWANVSKCWLELYNLNNNENIQNNISDNILRLLESNQVEYAQKVYELFIRSIGKNIFYYNLTSIIQMASGDFFNAQQTLLEGIAKFSHNFDLWYNFACVSYQLENSENGFVGLFNCYCLVSNDSERKVLDELVGERCSNFYALLPTIDIGIMSYNSEKYLPDCLDSILKQSYSVNSIIIVDDASTDGTNEIINSYKNYSVRIQDFYYEENSGCQSRAILKINEVSKSTFLSFISFDDAFFSKYAIQDFITEFLLDSELDFVCSNMFISSDAKVVSDIWKAKNYDKEFIYNHVFHTGSGLIPMGMGMFKNKFLKSLSIPYIVPNQLGPLGNSGADTLNMLYYLDNGMVYKVIDRGLMMYRLHESNISHSLKSRIASNFYVQEYIFDNPSCYSFVKHNLTVPKLHLGQEDYRKLLKAIHYFDVVKGYLDKSLIPNYITVDVQDEKILDDCSLFIKSIEIAISGISKKTSYVLKWERSFYDWLDYVKKDFNRMVDKDILRLEHLDGVVGISYYGRSGSVFLQSLLDNHPSVLMLPGIFLIDYGRFWTNVGNSFSSNVLKLIDVFSEFYSYLFNSKYRDTSNPSCPWEDVIFYCGFDEMGPEKNQSIQVDLELFKKALRDALYSETIVSRKTFFLSIQVAYFNALKRTCIKNRKYKIVYPLHAPLVNKTHHLWFLEDFPDSKILYTIREPLSNLNSIFNYFKNTKILDRNSLNTAFGGLGILTGPKHLYDFFCLENIGVVRLEDLHLNTKETLEKIISFIDIDWSDELLKSTFNGLLWWNFRDTVRVNGVNEHFKNSVNTSNFDLFDEFRIKLLLSAFYDIFGYERIRKINSEDIISLIQYPFKIEEDIPMKREEFYQMISDFTNNLRQIVDKLNCMTKLF